MEKPQIKAAKSPLAFPPHCKSHLKSETYRTLVRILSQCFQHPQLLETAPIPPQNPIPENTRNENEAGQGSEKEMCVGNEGISLQDGGFSDSQVVTDEIESMIRLEELLKQKDFIVNDDDCVSGLRDGGFLEHIMRGNEQIVGDGNCVTTALENCRGCDVVAFLNNQEKQVDARPIVVEECRVMGQQKVGKEYCSQNICKSFNLSSDKGMASEVSKPGENDGDKSLYLLTNDLGVNHEMHHKQIESEKVVCISCPMGSANHLIEDVEMEEGEVCDEFEVDDRLVDIFSEDAVLLGEKKLDKKQVSDDVIDKNKLPFNEKNKTNKKKSASTSFMVEKVDNANNGELVRAKQMVRSEMVCKRKVVSYEDPLLAEETVWHKKQKKVCQDKEQKKSRGAKEQKKGHGAKEQKKKNVAKDGVDRPVACPNIVALNAENSERASRSQGFTSKEKDAVLCNKKKRGPTSEERKAKKKHKKRRKRAEKNRELGVKRLTLRPVVKPKPVTFCRHFLQGKCREGEKCKFSHDTIPLTKSKPCLHFSRGFCMKGDDCQYDHELSKYSCDNYKEKGFCSRGESCKFSHMVRSLQDSSHNSDICNPNLKSPSLPCSSISKLLDIGGTSHNTDKALPDSFGVSSCKNTEQNPAKCVLNLPARLPKGIRSVSGGKTSIDESSHQKLDSVSLKSNEGVKVGNQIDQSASGASQNSGESPKGTPPVVAPKGINFLAFGKSPLGYSSTMKSTSLSITRGDGVKLSLSNDFNVKQARSSPNMDNIIQVGKVAIQSVSNRAPRLNEMVQKDELLAAALKPNPFSSGETTDSSRRNAQTTLPSYLCSVVDRSVEASKIASDKHKSLSALPWRLPAFPLYSNKLSDHLALGCLADTSNSAQKAVMSTLAFAVKVGSEMKMNWSTTSALAVGTGLCNKSGVSSTSGGSQNDSAKG